jgi:hypothetical protein
MLLGIFIVAAVWLSPWRRYSPVAFGMTLHNADVIADHKPAGGLLRDRGREGGAGQGERAAHRQRLVVQSLGVPLLDCASVVQDFR